MLKEPNIYEVAINIPAGQIVSFDYQNKVTPFMDSDFPIGIAARNLVKGEEILYIANSNTDDILTRNLSNDVRIVVY